MEETELFVLTLIPSKEAQAKGKKHATVEAGDRED